MVYSLWFRVYGLFLVLMLAPMAAEAQSFIKDANRIANEHSGLLRPLYWVKTVIDSSAIASVDRSYIEQPKHGLAVEARTTLNQATLKMESTWAGVNGNDTHLWSKSDNGLSTSLGLWVGYRGYGFGYSKEIGHTTGSTLSFGATGGSFGINLRIGSYRSDMPDIYINDEKISSYDAVSDRLEDPIHVRTLFLDGYYLFNGKHFSYAAAYDNSLIQRRSAGSLVAGGMYCHSRSDYSTDSNWELTSVMKDVGKVKFTQASLGAGYAYNWVPARGLLVSAMFMPMLTLYNRTTIYTYDIKISNPKVSGPDEWNRLSDDERADILEDPETIGYLENEREEQTRNRVKLNFDARLSIVYNWERWYVRASGHYNHFSYGSDLVSGRLTDWTAYASLGFRF